MRNKVDRALAGSALLGLLTEVLLRPDLAQRPVAIALGVVFACALLVRQSHPVGATVTAFALATAATLFDTWRDLPEVGPYTGACVLLLPYSLFRWGDRRGITLGLVFMAAAYTASGFHGEMKSVSEVIGGAVVMLFPCAVGASIRFRAVAQGRELEHAKLLEREQLARELHDSVAHHITAISIQAQAARAVVTTSPQAAMRALKAIEDESHRTLAELRAIVGALRDDAALAPQGRIVDIQSFATTGATPAIGVELIGDLEGLPASVERALYRLAQESITNAVKHARNATQIQIRVATERDTVRFTARDNGEAVSSRQHTGFGLIGMGERAALLGGKLEAGPSASGGWCVDAVLPVSKS